MKRPAPVIDVDALWALERVGSPSLSPDGAQAVVAVTAHDMEANTASASLWLLSTFGGAPRRLTACGDKDGAPAWSPAGDRIAFVAKREQQGRKDLEPQLYLIAPDGGEAVRATELATGVEAFKWFPDGRRIAFVSWVWPDTKGAKAQAARMKAWRERKESGIATGEAQIRWWDRHLPPGRVPHLHVLELDTGRVIDLFEGTAYELQRHDPDATHFDIAPDGTRIVFVHDPHAEKRADRHRALAVVEPKTRRIRKLVRDEAWDFDAPRFAPDGRRIACLARHGGVRHTMPAWLALVGGDGRWHTVSEHWDRSIDAPLRWTPDGTALLFGAEDRGRCPLWRFDLAARTAERVFDAGWVRGFDLAGDTIAVAADTQAHPPRVHVQRGSAPPLRIERFNDRRLGRLALGRHEAIEVEGAGGEPVQVWLTYPPGFDARRKYPLLHSIHGGPHTAAGDAWHWRWNTQVFAAQGYVVAQVNYHGSSGFGHAFLDAITHRWGELELQDIEAATTRLLREKWADPKRVFATGGSYGGYLVAWMNAKLPRGRYAAYVCHAGCWDWVAMVAEDAYGWFPKELGAAYWEDMERVHAQSAHAFAKGLTTPTLVVHGALDYRVPDAQGLAYYQTLKMQGIAARWLWFPDENHWVLKPRNSRQWYGEYFAWLERHDPARRRKER